MNDFEKGFIAAFIGYWIGHKIDNTRFGIWFNTNPTVTKIWNAGKALLLAAGAFLVVMYAYFVIRQF